MNNQSQQIHPWHAIDLPSLEHSIDATSRGLSGSEAAERFEKLGPNVLPHQPPPAWWQILLHQFRSPLIYILAVAAVVSVTIWRAATPRIVYGTGG